jgi:hypothetical protein
MTIQEQLQQDLKIAMKARDRLRIDVIRGARAALQSAQQEADKQRYDAARREASDVPASDDNDEQTAESCVFDEMKSMSVPLTEDEQQAVIAREVKRRREAAALYQQAGQKERAEQEEEEARVLESYLPQQLSVEELRPQVAAVIDELGVSGPVALGKLMPVLIERFKGRAEGRVLNQLARELLTAQS